MSTEFTCPHAAYWYIVDEVLPQNVPYLLSDYLDYSYMKVNPYTRAVDVNTSLNTQVEVWLEFGVDEDGSPCHDTDLDCGAASFEEAIIKLANKIQAQKA